jgi:hypothetical protein
VGLVLHEGVAGRLAETLVPRHSARPTRGERRALESRLRRRRHQPRLPARRYRSLVSVAAPDRAAPYGQRTEEPRCGRDRYTAQPAGELADLGPLSLPLERRTHLHVGCPGRARRPRRHARLQPRPERHPARPAPLQRHALSRLDEVRDRRGARPDATGKQRIQLARVRWAYNFPIGSQIVPGIGVPIGVGASRGDRAFIVYMSFEHPLAALR